MTQLPMYREARVRPPVRAGLKIAVFATLIFVNLTIAVAAFSPWGLGPTLRHFAAAPSCGMARLVGLAPARVGAPGYWPAHDIRHNGVACELRHA